MYVFRITVSKWLKLHRPEVESREQFQGSVKKILSVIRIQNVTIKTDKKGGARRSNKLSFA